MAKSTTQIEVRVELYKPPMALAGDEAIRLAQLFKEFGGTDYDRLTKPIRDGFAHNFQQEGTPEGPWESLADWTVEEREMMLHNPEDFFAGRITLVPGFTPERPILQRTGSYKESWIRFGPMHGLKVTMSGLEGGNIEILEGSKDPRAEKLSLGGKNVEGHIVPARPVNIIEDVFIGRMQSFLEGAAQQHARMIK